MCIIWVRIFRVRSWPSPGWLIMFLYIGDAGQLMFGPIGREVLSLGTIIFAVFAVISNIIMMRSIGY